MSLRPIASVARALGCFATLALLSACAGGSHISATQEAEHYEQHARRTYTAPGSAADPWGPYITEASARFDVPERWVREVMRVESGGHTELNGHPITSGAGAMGLMQVMPATYDELRGRYDLGDDPYDPHNSILAGTAYIRELYDLYGSPGFLAAYNGGPGRLDDFITRNRPLPDETRRYVAKIGPYITDAFPAKRSTAEMYAMNNIPAAIPAGPRYTAPDTAAYVPPEPAPKPSYPVEVAYAPPASDDGAFDPPPGWRPPNMTKSEVAAYVPPPGDPAPASSYQGATPLAATPLPPPPAPVEVAAMPDPLPRPAAPRRSYAYEPPPPPQARQGFRLVAPATAAPAPPLRTGPGDWAIQVGAFGNEGLAHIAVGQARQQAGAVVAAAHPSVAGVREPHGTLYRARLIGLSHDAASQACERLRARTNCIVLSPAAQS